MRTFFAKLDILFIPRDREFRLAFSKMYTRILLVTTPTPSAYQPDNRVAARYAGFRAYRLSGISRFCLAMFVAGAWRREYICMPRRPTDLQPVRRDIQGRILLSSREGHRSTIPTFSIAEASTHDQHLGKRRRRSWRAAVDIPTSPFLRLHLPARGDRPADG